MKIRVAILTCTIALTLIMGSCLSQKKLTYLQYTDIPEGPELPVRDLRIGVTPAAYKIMPYDILFIRVITPDPQWSILFNTTQVGQGGAITQESASLVGYPVDDDGNIDIPYIGKVNVSGKTLSDIKVELDQIFINYLNDAAITVRLVNNYISVIGEIRTPGRYPINKERLNVFEALAASGDIELYGNRQKIQLIRPSPYGPIVKEFTLSDRSILTSEFYYVMPNDILYVQPLRGKGFQNNATVFNLFLTTITTSLVIISFFR